MGELKDLLNKK